MQPAVHKSTVMYMIAKRMPLWTILRRTVKTAKAIAMKRVAGVDLRQG